MAFIKDKTVDVTQFIYKKTNITKAYKRDPITGEYILFFEKKEPSVNPEVKDTK